MYLTGKQGNSMIISFTDYYGYLKEKSRLALLLAEFLKRVCSKFLLEGRLLRSPMAA